MRNGKTRDDLMMSVLIIKVQNNNIDVNIDEYHDSNLHIY